MEEVGMRPLIQRIKWIFLSLVVFVGGVGTAHGFAPRPVKAFGGAGADWVQTKAVDANGNIYAAGIFTGTFAMEGQTRTSQGGFDIFLAKYNSSAQLQWLQSYGSTGDDSPSTLTIDSQGKIWLLGYFQNTIQFGGGALRSNGNEDIFLARFNANGSHEWSSSWGGNGVDTGNYLSINSDSEVVLAGSTDSAELKLGTLTLRRQGQLDGFVARLSTSGVFSWAKLYSAGAGRSAEVLVLAHNSKGNPVIGGYIETNTPQILSVPKQRPKAKLSANRFRAFSAELARNNGNEAWRRNYDCGGWCSPSSMGIDSQDEIYLAGTFEGSMKIDSIDLRSLGESNFFLSRLRGSNGAVNWAKAFGGQSYDAGISVEATASDSVYAVATITDTLNFGGGALVPGAGKTSLGLAKFNRSGALQWSEQYVGDEGTGAGGGYGGDSYVTISPNGDLIINGWFIGTITVNGTRYKSEGSWDSILIFRSP
jgi:hypothetical protein